MEDQTIQILIIVLTGLVAVFLVAVYFAAKDLSKKQHEVVERQITSELCFEEEPFRDIDFPNYSIPVKSEGRLSIFNSGKGFGFIVPRDENSGFEVFFKSNEGERKKKTQH